MTVFIYGLRHPETGAVAYIGASTRPEIRLREHITAPHCEGLAEWIEGLASQGWAPELVLLEESGRDTWRIAERRWIIHFRDAGHMLLNAQDNPHPDASAARSGQTESRLPNTHPGEVIREEFLKPWGMTPYRLAKGTGLSTTAVHEILNGRRAITAVTALRLSAYIGCSPRFWLNLQAQYDLREARRDPALAEELSRITRYEAAADAEADREAA